MLRVSGPWGSKEAAAAVDRLGRVPISDMHDVPGTDDVPALCSTMMVELLCMAGCHESVTFLEM